MNKDIEVIPDAILFSLPNVIIYKLNCHRHSCSGVAVAVVVVAPRTAGLFHNSAV